MPTYSPNLAINLPNDGEYSGTWGQITNNNLGTLVEQSISGYVTQGITDGADTVITIPLGATGVARNMYIEGTGNLTAQRNLVVPTLNKKLYLFFNNTTNNQSVQVKTSGGTGVVVANGARAFLVCDGVNVQPAATFFGAVDINGGTIDGTPIGATTPSTGSFTTVNVTGATPLPANGLYLPSANTLGMTTNSIQRATIDVNGKMTVIAPTSAGSSLVINAFANDTVNAIQLPTRGSMINFARSADGSLALYVGSRSGSSNISLYNAGGVSSEFEVTGGGFNFYVNSVVHGAMDSAGRWTIGPPNSGVALTIQANPTGSYTWISATTSGYIVASTMNDAGYTLGHNSSARTFELQTNSTTRISIAGGGNVTINAPTAGAPLTVSSSGVQTAVVADASGATGSALRLVLAAANSRAIETSTGANTGAAVPTLSANKPGGANGVFHWMFVVIGGTGGYIPVFGA